MSSSGALRGVTRKRLGRQDETAEFLRGDGEFTPVPIWTESAATPTGGSPGDWHVKQANQDPMLFKNQAGTWEPRLMLSQAWDRNPTWWTNANFNKHNTGVTAYGSWLLTDLLTTVPAGLTKSGNNVTLPNANTTAAVWGTTFGFVGASGGAGSFEVTTLPSASNIQFGVSINAANFVFVGCFQVTSAGAATFGASNGATYCTFTNTVTATTYNKFAIRVLPGAFLVVHLNGAAVVQSAFIPSEYATGTSLLDYGPTLYFKGSGSGTAAVVAVTGVEFYQ